MNKVVLHVEGLAILVLSIYFYASLDYSWTLFFILFLAPDLAMLGYLKNSQVGAVVYNLFHTYSVPIAIIMLGLLLQNQVMLAVGLIWIAHIGMDRMVGYGLKYPTEFKDTHLNRV